jgi:hypothetical protein
MKLKNILLIFASGLVLSSCGSRYNNPEELAVPVVRAIQHDDAGDLQCMLPGIEDVNAIFEQNPELLGITFYNKYTKSYRLGELKAAMRIDLDVIDRMSKEQNLDWDKVGLGNVTKEDVTDAGKSYTKVTADLMFPDAGTYKLVYNVVNYNSKWFLLNEVSLQKRTD